ncbi:MAG: valine--tRNA ligase [Clostridia bacterium]
MELEKSYNPQGFEKDLYREWEENGYFTAKVDKSKKPFAIMMPPPNITGQLHLGHALDETLQDTLTRFKRMCGFSALWLPGTDHASIATEVKIVDQMATEGLKKEDIGRDAFLERAWKWKAKYGDRIIEQLKTLGASCDWSRLAFTMDDKCSKAVKDIFVKLYNDGLIYQGSRIINWCPSCQTALSDAEVEYEEQNSFFWHIRYPLADGSGEVVIATTRPETLLGDTAVAVHPDDERYKSMVGKTLILPIVNKEIPIVADKYVDMQFGTGCVKITPAHDPNDFEVGLRHNLEVIRVMNDDGTMNELAGKYQGMTREACREAIVQDLKDGGYLVKIEPHVHNVGTCYRCHTSIETIVSKQWFVKMESLAKPALDAVRNGETNFVPKRFENTYFAWMENIRDWCISRQLWWGHRIPAYYCEQCGETIVSAETPTKCPKCGCVHLKQDEDVLDTWFSSALWPFSTLGYPDKTEDLDYFYPTSVLVTGYDIIFFWVARMIFSGIYAMDTPPFKDVLIHGIIRDAQGRKMSKSLGNGIDPIEVIDKFGADTLRFSLLNGVAMGSDSRFLEEKLDSSKNFMNKIWNASRFALMNFENKEIGEVDFENLSLADKWIITRLNETTRDIRALMDKYDMGICASNLYDFVWNEICDWYIELIKPVLYGDDEVQQGRTLNVLNYVMQQTLKLLHPFIPFVTEKLYREFPNASKTIMLEDYPDGKEFFESEKICIESVMELIKSIRAVRKEMDVPPSKRSALHILPANDAAKATLETAKVYVEKLGFGTEIHFIKDRAELKEDMFSATSVLGQVFMASGDLINKEKELLRLKAEFDKIQEDVDFANGKLNNVGFMGKAPEKVKADIRLKLETALHKQNNIKELIAKLN